MTARGFHPKEVLFSLTTRCNLRCAHCAGEGRPAWLDTKSALRFLAACGRFGIRRVGFTGGEPFLALDALCALSREAVRRGMLFGRIMTNGAWFRTTGEFSSALYRLFKTGYDGDLCVSVDAFHRQDLRKCASFIRAAAGMWGRPDIASIAAVRGARQDETRIRLVRLARLLRGRVIGYRGRAGAIRSADVFVRIEAIDLSPVGKAAALKDGWDGRWFRDDLCRGPGNVLYVLPDGTVKPCCGYATGADILTIGSIDRDTPRELLRRAGKNRFVRAIFTSGFHPIRRRLERSGVRFPGKTTNHCFFCRYLTHSFGRRLLNSKPPGNSASSLQ